MKKITATLMLIAFAVSAFAVEQGQVQYTGGTIASIKEGTIGKLDTTSDTTLTFESGSTKLAIPYAKIESYQYSQVLAHHLGVVATVAVVLVKYRERRHFFRIQFRDEHDVNQVAVLEVSKDMPRALQAVLAARAPKPAAQAPTSCRTNRGCALN